MRKRGQKGAVSQFELNTSTGAFGIFSTG